jgi:hypothetical protein
VTKLHLDPFKPGCLSSVVAVVAAVEVEGVDGDCEGRQSTVPSL